MFAEHCFACRHVLDGFRPVLYVSRDHDDWIFSCGEGDHGGLEDWGRAHTHHFLEADPSIEPLAALAVREQAARYRKDAEWLRLPRL